MRRDVVIVPVALARCGGSVRMEVYCLLMSHCSNTYYNKYFLGSAAQAHETDTLAVKQHFASEWNQRMMLHFGSVPL